MGRSYHRDPQEQGRPDDRAPSIFVPEIPAASGTVMTHWIMIERSTEAGPLGLRLFLSQHN